MLSYEKKEGEKILLSIFGFKICVVVFNRIMCCYAETKDLVISRVFSPGDFRLRGWGLQEEWKGISGPEQEWQAGPLRESGRERGGAFAGLTPAWHWRPVYKGGISVTGQCWMLPGNCVGLGWKRDTGKILS